MELCSHSLQNILQHKPQLLTLGWHHCTPVLLELIPQEWELFNTWHRNSPVELNIYAEYEIYDKFIKLDLILDSMCVPIHSTRPECSQVLSEYNLWSILVSEVSQYKRFYEELHSLGSGAFGEVMII
ncbi:unnamed protein product [Oppiella nova]|uniref:Uncharacterized protein n=1 Tax=Oppiella nova TaxID=334625 RepID=A0A7R9M5M1_9ACAR|nr:unnamed protein product [Oppiella nova]CAG2171109.1 unnamed protein product [Oppiella nova]